MEATAHSKFQRFGARKVAQVLSEIRGKRELEVEQILPMTAGVCGRVIEKAGRSAEANRAIKAARAGRSLVPARVYIKSCWAGPGPMGQMKRGMRAAPGGAMPLKRKEC